ncbi:D-isomer specific 2-hydroxyacid dehydrogenase [Staphylotrichum tortipilum]|uniref:D-isomer specific 2-hydroxyacid dehydrogenase n=1 Tax=Staphylotrichum tortipilum TaxID=2831512 RepID=A0AAN6RTD3_9PEZI|nr:D-isomer specific 2-hydroxyacid dehydrogenase [Staphylotrichum longicolle]
MTPVHGARPKVLLLGVIEHAHTAWASVAEIADIIRPASTDRTSFLEEAAAGTFEGSIAAYRTFDSFDATGKVDAELLDALPRSIRFICHNGAGYDQVDVQACTARCIRVSNTPTAVDDATADIAIFLMLGAMRNLGVGMAALRAGEWRGVNAPALGHDPQGKVLGILGMGGIGRNMAKKALAFGMKIRYHNRTRLDAGVEDELGVKYVAFDELLAGSDVLSVNLPLNKNTRHIISEREFAKMKKGIVMVNTARGAVIDEAALVEALASGQVSSAGLDVYEQEPSVHPGLLSNPRVILVPHMGTWTVETETKMEEWAISNIRLAIETGKLRSIVPEQRDM